MYHDCESVSSGFTCCCSVVKCAQKELKQGSYELGEERNYDSEPEAEETDLKSEASGEFGDGTLCDPNFKYRDANVELQVGGLRSSKLPFLILMLLLQAVNRHFWVHKFMLYKFQGLEAMLNGAPSDREDKRQLLVLNDSAEDIRNMLLVLYSR